MLQNLSSLVEELNITRSSQSLQGSDATDHIEGVYSMIEQLSNWNSLDLQPLCVKQYQSLLDNLTQYLSTIKSSGDLSMFSEAFLAGVQMEKLQKDAQTLDNITTQYLNGNLAKIRLCRLLDVDYILQLKADMQDVYSAMKTGMFRVSSMDGSAYLFCHDVTIKLSEYNVASLKEVQNVVVTWVLFHQCILISLMLLHSF